jgi:hypothetical protein
MKTFHSAVSFVSYILNVLLLRSVLSLLSLVSSISCLLNVLLIMSSASRVSLTLVLLLSCFPFTAPTLALT